MTTAETSTTDWLSKRRTYRRLMFGSIIAGVALNLLFWQFEYPIVAEAAYWAGIVAFFAVWRGTDQRLIDERDWELERRASLSAIQLVGAVTVAGASAARLLPQFTEYTVSPMIQGVFYGYIGLFIAFGASYLWHRSRL